VRKVAKDDRAGNGHADSFCVAASSTPRNGESPLTLLLADDHPAILDSVASLLRDERIDVVGRARTGAEALELVERRDPAVALLDRRLPDLSGIEVARRIVRTFPRTATLLYTGHADSALVHEALDAGLRGVVLKEAPLPDLPRAIAIVARGGTYLDPLLGGALATSGRDARQLTAREREVLRLLSNGHTNAEVGVHLYLSPETVRTHVRKAVARLGVQNRTQAVAMALREGLIR
jgi:DNA-binding NarL/FixJ family response regulator